MRGVLTGFAVIATVIAVGYVIGRRGYLGQDGRTVLTRPAFNASPRRPAGGPRPIPV